MSSKRGRFFLLPPPRSEFQISRIPAAWFTRINREERERERGNATRRKRNPINVNFADRNTYLRLCFRNSVYGWRRYPPDSIRGRRQGRKKESSPLFLIRKLIRHEAPQGSPTFLFPVDISRGENKSVARPVPMQLR